MSVNQLLGSTNDPIGDYYFFGREKLKEGLSFELEVEMDPYQGLFSCSGIDGLVKETIKNPTQLLSQIVTLVDSQTSSSNYMMAYFNSLTKHHESTVHSFVRSGFTKPVLYTGRSSDLVEIKITSDDHVIFEAKHPKFSYYVDELLSPYFDHLRFTSEDLIEIIKNKKIQIYLRVIPVEANKEGELLSEPNKFIYECFKHYLAHLHLLMRKGGSDAKVKSRFEMLGIPFSNQIESEIDLYLKRGFFYYDDCLKMTLLMKNIDNSRTSDILIKEIDDQYKNISSYLHKWKEFYTSQKVIGSILEEKDVFR